MIHSKSDPPCTGTEHLGVITGGKKGAPNLLADTDDKFSHDQFASGGDAAKQASTDRIAKFSQGSLSLALPCQPGLPGYDNTRRNPGQAAKKFNEPHVFTALIA